MTVVYMDTDDIYQLFLNFNVPGVRKEAARLAKGVNMGDAGVINEALQSAHDPSAGQRAMQAGEAVPQQSLTADHLLAAIQTNNTSLTSAFGTAVGTAIKTNNVEMISVIGTAVGTAIKTNNAEMISAFGSVIKTNNAEMISTMNAKMAEYKADTDAKMAESKADTDAKMTESKADTDAKMAEYKADADAKMAEYKADTDAKMAKIMNALAPKIPTWPANKSEPKIPLWPANKSELHVGVNDTWNVFQYANKGRSVTPADWHSARTALLAGSNGAESNGAESNGGASLPEPPVPPRMDAAGPQAAAPVSTWVQAPRPFRAPAAPALAPQTSRAKPGRNTIMEKKITLEWLLRNLSHPFPTANDLEMLRQQTGIDTTQRMYRLVVDIRKKRLEQNKDGKWIVHDK
jgi:hypothetical protein